MNIENGNPYPSKEEIKELTKFIKDVTPGVALLINPIAPTVTQGGVVLNEKETAKYQEAINKKGISVARNFKGLENIEYSVGDKVLLSANAVLLGNRNITSKFLLTHLKKETIEQINHPDFNPEEKPKYYRRFTCLFFYYSDILCKLNYE